MASPRAVLTTRAIWWAIGQLRREHATVEGLSRQLGVTWNTLWRVVEPRLAELAGDESRFDGVTTLGVDGACQMVCVRGVASHPEGDTL